MYTLTAAQADEGDGARDLKLRNVKGQGGVVEGSDVDDLIALTHLHEPAILFTLEVKRNPPSPPRTLTLLPIAS